MAGPIPPAPVKDDAGSFAWLSWYQTLRSYLNNTGSVPWRVIDKTGSSLADLTTRLHSSLTSVFGTGSFHVSSLEGTLLTNLQTTGHAALSSILGTGSYHISASEAARVSAITVIQSKVGAPVAADIPPTNWAIYKDTTANTIRLWANDGGVLKSVLLT